MDAYAEWESYSRSWRGRSCRVLAALFVGAPFVIVHPLVAIVVGAWVYAHVRP